MEALNGHCNDRSQGFGPVREGTKQGRRLHPRARAARRHRRGLGQHRLAVLGRAHRADGRRPLRRREPLPELDPRKRLHARRRFRDLAGQEADGVLRLPERVADRGRPQAGAVRSLPARHGLHHALLGSGDRRLLLQLRRARRRHGDGDIRHQRLRPRGRLHPQARRGTRRRALPADRPRRAAGLSSAAVLRVHARGRPRDRGRRRRLDALRHVAGLDGGPAILQPGHRRRVPRAPLPGHRRDRMARALEAVHVFRRDRLRPPDHAARSPSGQDRLGRPLCSTPSRARRSTGTWPSA